MVQLVALVNIWNILGKAGGVQYLALLDMLELTNAGRFPVASSHIRVGKSTSGQAMNIVDRGTVIGQEHVIPSRERPWIVNRTIDLWIFNQIYSIGIFYIVL